MLLVGIVRRPHGTAGEVSVEPATDFPERFVAGLDLVWRRNESERALTIDSARLHGSRVLIHFRGVEDAESARELSGGDLLVREEDAVATPEGFYYGYEIEGWRCEDPQGRLVGRVSKLEQTPGGPMLFVDSGRKEPVAVPFTHPIVLSVDREGQRIVLDPPEGLLDL